MVHMYRQQAEKIMKDVINNKVKYLRKNSVRNMQELYEEY